MEVPTLRLETARIILLPWDSQDWLTFRHIATDPRVMRYISAGVPWPDKQVIAFVDRQRLHFEKLSYCLWKLMVKGDLKLAGFCGLQPLDDLDGIEIGWWLAPKHWGKGIATEAARAAMQDGFERCGLERIVAVALQENRASTRIMEKLGMKYERDVKHHGFDVVLYAIESACGSK
jgi:ribosomal-protein-alanine N-acetyltransferase